MNEVKCTNIDYLLSISCQVYKSRLAKNRETLYSLLISFRFSIIHSPILSFPCRSFVCFSPDRENIRVQMIRHTEPIQKLMFFNSSGKQTSTNQNRTVSVKQRSGIYDFALISNARAPIKFDSRPFLVESETKIKGERKREREREILRERWEREAARSRGKKIDEGRREYLNKKEKRRERKKRRLRPFGSTSFASVFSSL